MTDKTGQRRKLMAVSGAGALLFFTILLTAALKTGGNPSGGCGCQALNQTLSGEEFLQRALQWAGEGQPKKDPYRQEEYVDSYQQIDLDTGSITISNVKLVKEVDLENIHMEYPYLNNGWDEVSRKINEQIYNNIISRGEDGKAGTILMDNDGCRTEADITYRITYMDENVISILFSGEAIEGWGFAYFDRGLNFNLQSGEILSLADFYELAQIKDLVQGAVSKNRLTVTNFDYLNGKFKEEYFNSFLQEFDTDDYIKRTNNFFIQEGSICFIAGPPPSFRENIYLEMEVKDIKDRLAGINAASESDSAADDMDSWLGKYSFVDAFPHNSGELNYVIGLEMTIYKQDGDYYAQINGDGWFLETRTSARVAGNQDSVDITFLETLPGDSLYENNIQRYEYGEELLHLKRLENGEIRTEWGALRDQHPIFVEMEGKISGSYFEKEGGSAADA